MVNPRTIASNISKSESKELLDKAQTIIDTKIKGPNTKSRRDKLLSAGAHQFMAVCEEFFRDSDS